MENSGAKGYVYLLCDPVLDRVYKIGVTKGTIENRIKKLQTGNSGEIYVVNYYQTEHPFFIEKKLHDKYSASRVLNEWFELTDDEARSFKEDCRKIEELISFMQENNPFFPKKVS